jgi:hypothetical protein
MGIRALRIWLLLIGLLGFIDKATSGGFTTLDYTLRTAINSPQSLLSARQGV